MSTQPRNPLRAVVYSRYGPIPQTVSITDEQELIAACRAGKYDYIFVKNHRHLARNAQDLLRLTREVKSHGVIIHFKKEGLVV
jgi:hypothetical protein